MSAAVWFAAGAVCGACAGVVAAALAITSRHTGEWCSWCAADGHQWECCPDFVEVDR